MSEDVHIRDTIKYTDYKQFGSTMKIVSVDGVANTTPPSAQTPPQKPKQ